MTNQHGARLARLERRFARPGAPTIRVFHTSVEADGTRGARELVYIADAAGKRPATDEDRRAWQAEQSDA